MNLLTRVLVWSTTIAVAVTGGLYAVFAYCMSPADPMDLDNHPWQSVTLHAHVLAAPLWMFAFGAVWHSHVLPKLGAKGARWRSGLLMLGLAFPMVASGYLLQTSVKEWWRQVWVVVHVSSSIVWVVPLLAHWSAGLRRGRLGVASDDLSQD